MKLQMDENRKYELRKYFTPLWACAAFIKAKQQQSHIYIGRVVGITHAQKQNLSTYNIRLT